MDLPDPAEGRYEDEDENGEVDDGDDNDNKPKVNATVEENSEEMDQQKANVKVETPTFPMMPLLPLPDPLALQLTNSIPGSAAVCGHPTGDAATAFANTVLHLYRSQIDITDPQERKKLDDRLAATTDEVERRGIEAYIRQGFLSSRVLLLETQCT